MWVPFVVVERNVELVGESVDNGSADTQTGERAGARVEGDFGNVFPVGMVSLQFIVNKGEDLLGEVVVGIPRVGSVVKAELAGVGRGIEVEFHREAPVDLKL